jgi:hypothetical protein
MKKNLRKLYQKYLKGDEKTESKKCKARLKNCHQCGTRYNKDDTICRECNEPRRTCDKWAIQGKEVCKTHGGNAGRKMTKGVHITKGTFNSKDWEIIKTKIQEKSREHEFVYQVAMASFRKIVETSEDPVINIGAASECMSKIIKYMTDIDKVESDMIHIHTLDEVDKQKLEQYIKKVTDRVLASAMVIIIGILKRNVQDQVLYNKIYDEIPQAYKDLLVQKIELLQKNDREGNND